MINPKFLNKDIYKRAKAQVDKEHAKHSAYKSAAIIKRYKDLGGNIDESKSSKGLQRWFKQKWINLTPFSEGIGRKTEYKCGQKAKGQKGPSVCRPAKVAEKLSLQKIKRAVQIKNKGNRISWDKL